MELPKKICSFGIFDINLNLELSQKEANKYNFNINKYNYIEELKNLTGLDSAVSDYVMSFKESRDYYGKLKEFFDLTIPMYAGEGKSQLVISFGCTGGQHRSVYCAEYTAKRLHAKYGVHVHLIHRERNIDRNL